MSEDDWLDEQARLRELRELRDDAARTLADAVVGGYAVEGDEQEYRVVREAWLAHNRTDWTR